MDAAPSVRRGGLGHAKLGGASLFGGTGSVGGGVARLLAKDGARATYAIADLAW